MNVTRHDIQRIIIPLRLIFWGGIICVLDISINNFDILNDFIGSILIAIGVFQIATVEIHDRYSNAMLFVKIMAILGCIRALFENFSAEIPPLLGGLFALIGFAEMIAIVVFCVAIGWLSREAKLDVSEKSWQTTTILFTIIYLIPLGLFYLIAVFASATGNSFHINLGPAGLLLVPVFFVPLIHFFVSTSRMKNEAQSNSDDQQDVLTP